MAALASSTSPERIASTMRLCSATVAFRTSRLRQRMKTRTVENRTRRIEQPLRTRRIDGAKDRRVERLIEIVEPHHVVLAHRRRLRIEVVVELLEQFVIGVLRYAADRLDLEPGADQHALAHILRADQRDEAAALREYVDQSFRREARDGLVDRRARRTGFDRDLVLAQPRARQQLHLANAPPQLAVNPLRFQLIVRRLARGTLSGHRWMLCMSARHDGSM